MTLDTESIMSLYSVTNPATDESLQDYPVISDAEVQNALVAADSAFRGWNRKEIDGRAKLLGRVAELYLERREELAMIITREMGKPIAQAQGEVDIVASIYRYYARNGSEFLKDEELEVEGGGRAIIRKDGLGVLLGVMPWNYPYYQVARFAAPNLLNGNTILLKPAPQCPESAAAMEQIFLDAGAPSGVYISILATNEQVADIIADPRVQGVSLTGSERAGAAVAEIAGRNLKKVVLELGGSDPFLVLNSANIDQAADHALHGRFGNAGQACNAAKRIIVDDAVYEEFVAKFVDAVRAMKVGDPTEPDTFMGPLSSVTARDELALQVEDAVARGATVLTGGCSVDRPGAWFQPTVLADVTPEMRAFSEELFGPVAVLYRVSSEDEAVQMANDSAYGLGAVIQSSNPMQAQLIANRLEAGMVYINEAPGTAAELPFGGIKRSGIGRELGRYGVDEFVNRKLIRTAL
jgi:succinate-semialdehyde dehydrogenase/glutarate-semialdehyde dehydrogenase